MNKRILRISTVLMVAIMALFAVSIAFANPPGDTRLRVFHGSPDAPNVDVYVDGNLAIPNLGFEEFTSYIPVPAGSYQIQVNAAGQGYTGPFVISATLPFAADTDYTIAATDVLTNITPIVLTDDNTQPSMTETTIRFVHASPDAPNVDITDAMGNIIFGNVAFQETVSGTVPAGSYDLEVRVAGTSNVALDLPPIDFAGETVYTAWATGQVSNSTLNAVLTVDAGPINLRVAHLSPDAPAVDVLANGGALFSNASYPAVTDYATVPAQSYFVEVVGAGTTGPAVISGTFTFDPLNDYTVAAVNTLSNIEPLPLVDDNTLPSMTETKVRFVHASPDAPAVDVTLDDGTPVFTNIAFKGVGDYLTLPAGSYDLQVRLAGTTTVALDLPPLPLDAETVYTVWAIGEVGNQTLDYLATIDAQPADPTDVTLASFDGQASGNVAPTTILFAIIGLLVLLPIIRIASNARREQI